MAPRPPSAPPSGGGGSFLTRSAIGGIPNWVLLAGGAVLIYVVVSRRNTAAQQSPQAATQPSPYPAAYGGGQTPVYILGGSGNGGFDTGTTGQVTAGNSGLPSASTPTTDTSVPAATPAAGPSYIPLGSLQAVQQDIATGTPVYQSGQEALAWDIAHGTPAGQTLPNTGAYYQLAGPAAENLFGSGQPVYVRQG